MSADDLSNSNPAAPPTAAGDWRETKIRGAGQIDLFVRRVQAEGEPRARLLWVHGFAEHSGRYVETLGWFAARGFESWMLDLRGHGHSDGERVSIDQFTDYLDDIGAFYDYAKQHSSQASDFCLGHSMGGLALSRWLQEHRPDPGEYHGAVILSPFMGLKFPIPAWTTFASRVLSQILPHYLLPSKFSTEVLSKDPEVGRAYTADPMIPRGASSRWFTETVAAQAHAKAEAELIELPLLVMHGLDDGLADVDATREFYDGISSDDRELKLWDGLRHELLNEVEKEEVREYILGWLEGRLG